MIGTATCEAEPKVFTTPAPPLENVEAVKAFLVTESARLCASAVKGEARAVVLTGSMSRGEATFKRDEMGWRVLGDATFLVVFDRPVTLCTAEVEAEIVRFLLAHAIRCTVVVITTTASALRKMKPHIYAFELRERGIVVWGDPTALQLMPRYAAAEIPKEDGWWLLCNRMIEQLETAARADGEQNLSTAVSYRIAKLYLAMAACYLLSIGEYKPSYRERDEELTRLAASQCPPSSPIPLQRFSRFVSTCTSLKINGKAPHDFSDFPEWCDAVSDAEALWRWAVAQISGSQSRLDRSTLLARAAKLQRGLTRAKGWARSAYVQRAALWRYWSRWARLACLASPRYLIYGAASDLFFASPERDAVTPQKLEEIAERLPLVPAQDGRQLTWKATALMVAYNFHCLVESTRT